MYLQDWLNVQTEDMPEFEVDLSLERKWLDQMGSAAESHDITILYCMWLPRHMLQTVEIPSVTTIRVSGDYAPGLDQWKIGYASSWTFALDLSPFKDTFWTSPVQKGNPRYDQRNQTETRCELQAAVATLSTSIVAIGDKGITRGGYC